MREILFRGKRTTAEGFVYGYYAVFDGRNHSISNDDGNYWVAPETVGQFTGLTDKNGKMIFEGDIITYNGDAMEVKWDTPGALFYFKGIRTNNWIFDFCNLQRSAVEVIGNVYDNPELLEVSEDG